jgi:hypothetical protein
MDPITTTAISLVVSNLAKQAFDSFFNTTTEEVTKSSLEWLKSIFFEKDGNPKEELTDLQNNPEDPLNKDAAELIIKKNIRKEPSNEKYLIEIADYIKSATPANNQHNTIQYSKNVNTGAVNASGNVNIGDNIQH